MLQQIGLLGGSVCFALQIILIERFIQNSDPLLLVMIQVAMGTIVNGIAALITGEPFTVRMLTDSMDVIIYTGVISLGIANLLQFLGQPRVSSVTAAVACSFESVFGLTFGVILLGESL